MPEGNQALSRRQALGKVAHATGAFAAVAQSHSQGADLPIDNKRSDSYESYWRRFRHEQFVIPDNRIFLNNGSLGVTPRPVLSAMKDYLDRAAALAMADVPRWGYESLMEERTELAEFLHCQPENLAFTHNCTEAMSIIANGLELAAGDEVILTDQEHGSGIECWRLKEFRAGIQVKEVKIPIQPTDPGELVAPLMEAIGPRTKVISFSGITTKTGLILPVQTICNLARERNVLTVLDGAHMNGQIPVNLAEIGCDYYAGSPHKWMFAPAGCGLLYGLGDRLDRLYPAVVTGGWKNKKGLHAARFMMVGTNNRVTIEGMVTGLRFLRRLGEESVYERLQALADYALSLANARDYLKVITPADPRFYRALVSIQFNSENVSPLMAALQERKFVVLGGRRMRISCHVHTRKSDLDHFFSVCDEILG